MRFEGCKVFLAGGGTLCSCGEEDQVICVDDGAADSAGGGSGIAWAEAGFLATGGREGRES